MNIDRNNYEMYFLLYVDNELSAEQRNAVEIFVTENTDLKAELDLLMQTALPADDVVFSAKDILYKKELTPGSIQEQMLLQLDDELDPKLLILLSAEIAANDDLKREWNILQQTKLDPTEKIVFKDKRSLYRHEKDNVTTMFFWRVAAAIFIIGLILAVGIARFSASTTGMEVAKSNGHQQPSRKMTGTGQTTEPLQENKIDHQSEQNLASVEEEVSNTSAKENKQDMPGKNLSTPSHNNGNNPIFTNKDAIANKKDDNNNIAGVDNNNPGNKTTQNENNILPKPYFENINKQDRNKTASLPVEDIKALQNKNKQEPVENISIAKVDNKEPVKTIVDRELTETDNSFAKNAVAMQTDAETNNNSILFISEEKVNRTKVSGIFKKVKRVLARNANIQSGKNVRIAGFEIATR